MRRDWSQTFKSRRGLTALLLLMTAARTLVLATAARGEERHAGLAAALAARGWVELPAEVIDVRYAGPTPAAAPGSPPGQAWFSTVRIDANTRPHPDEQGERAFVESVEAAHAGKTHLIQGGMVVLVDAGGRIWAVAAHTPHLLRCYDGKGWTYKRADGLPAAADEPAAFARLAGEGKLPRPEYAKGGLRDLNDLGRWYGTACADAAGNLHFFGSCVGKDAAARGTGGGGVHTLRPDGTWSFFRIYPADGSPPVMPFDGLRCVLHARSTKQRAAKAEGAAPDDLVTFAEFQLSDPVAEAHGQKVEPIPAGADEYRRQQWKDRTTEPRIGPVFFLRFDGMRWRFDRSSVGWGVYDAVFRAWPQPSGDVYLCNRFGFWQQWPANVPKARLDRLIADLFERDETKQAAAAQTLTSMGRAAEGALRAAVAEATTGSTKRRLAKLADDAGKVARGEEDAVPVIAGRWRFLKAYPQATMPDGRFVFFCPEVTDVRAGKSLGDCLVYFDPSIGAFNPRPIDRKHWVERGFPAKAPQEPPINVIDRTVIDADGGLWLPGGFRCDKEGRLVRVVPGGLEVELPHFVDPDGRVYFRENAPNKLGLRAYRPGPLGVPAPAPVAGGPAVDAASSVPTTRPVAVTPRAVPGGEAEIDHVRAMFRQPDAPPPWNAWAVQSRQGKPDLLLRLDGPEPTAVEPPKEFRSVQAVIPLEGGCIAKTREAAGFWDGTKWDVAKDVKTLVERHGRRLAKMAPTRVFSADTSQFNAGQGYVTQLMLASDARGGLWLAEDTADSGRRLWHWDGLAFTDVWRLLPLDPQRGEDGAVMTAERGRALIVQIEPNMETRPGGYWAVWRVTADDLAGDDVVPRSARRPGLFAKLLAARGPNTIFSSGLWADRQGWVWSPIFSEAGNQWVRRRDARVGPTALPRAVWPDTIVQPVDGPAWCVTGKMRDEPRVWVDVSPTGDEPKNYPRMLWVGATVPGMGPSSRLAAAPDGKVYLLHEGGCSLLRLKKLPKDAKPKLPVRTSVPPDAAGRAGVPEIDNWEIEEVARRKWDDPRNDFGHVAFDKSAMWILPGNGPLIRVPLPREDGK